MGDVEEPRGLSGGYILMVLFCGVVWDVFSGFSVVQFTEKPNSRILAISIYAESSL